MKPTKAVFVSSVILLALVASDAALARPGFHRGGGGVRLGLAVGIPIGIGLGYGYYGGYYGPPYYAPYYPPYYAPAMAVPYAAPTYIEQSSPPSAPAAQNYWYYCADSKSYYPYVSECSSGWQRVSPTPPPG